MPGTEVTTVRELFPEMREPGQLCRYRDCLHINEPDCEVKAALDVAARDQVVDELSKVLGIGKQRARDYAKNMTVSEIEKDIANRRRSLSR
jgi:ribosome biogenesis GTPase